MDEEPSPPSATSRVGSVGIGKSGLTVMMDRELERRQRQATLDEARERLDGIDAERTPMARPATLQRTDSETTDNQRSGEATPKAHRGSIATETVHGSRRDSVAISELSESDPNNSSALRRFLEGHIDEEDRSAVDERTALLANGDGGDGKKKPGMFSQLGEKVREVKQAAAKLTPADVMEACVKEPVKTLPSVILGCLLNVLDGVSYGMIL